MSFLLHYDLQKLLSKTRLQTILNKMSFNTRWQTFFNTVKSSNFVILLSEDIFFLQNFLRLPHNFFWYWSLYRRGLSILLKLFWPWTIATPRNFVFFFVEDYNLISSTSKVFKVTMATADRGCEGRHFFCGGKIL